MNHRAALLGAIVFANNKAKRLAIRLTKWTGKSREYVHPKHLLGETEEQYWYLARLDRADRLLDVGCGNAMHSLKAARRCASVAGIDRSTESLGVGRRAAASLGAKNVRLVQGDVEAGLPFVSDHFDKVLCLDLLEHVEKRDLVLGEIRRVLKPRGLLLLAVPNRLTSWKRRLERAGLPFYSDPDHKIEYSESELADELERNGFMIGARVPGVYDTPLIGVIDLLGSLSLSLYRRLSALRRRLASRHPIEDAGFFLVCHTEGRRC
jgi:SAM-dependent methyltransferase